MLWRLFRRCNMSNLGITPMGDCICRIERLENGYEVELFDPETEKENSKNKTYRSPYKSYAFETTEAVLKFLKENLEKSKKTDVFGDAFKKAVAVKEKK